MRADNVILSLLYARGPGRSICPSEAARTLARAEGTPDWRSLMDRVRRNAASLARRKVVVVTQRGNKVDALSAQGAIRIALVPETTAYADAYRGIDFRAHPERYRIGRGEQGVLIAEPYKSELLPLWRFKTPAIARRSAASLWSAFVAYRRAEEPVGMDMARKFLQMGFTRARRYANHRSGRKYEPDGGTAPRAPDPIKAEAAAVFYVVWQRTERDRSYRAWRAQVTATAKTRSTA